ncbi:chain length-determining protein [Caldimonas thermodepolymerans]|uniref:Chain length-determining protein n=2 Tax=Caldimonas thermodepolymerans TaxID=215580 RepID=A0A2S5T2L6_9BURK|nr:XrtA system polysaccharide chain length determinant [Caldimonas thermodepolymerans]PPE69169.1 chain length-determining protein [Caldimonas thermodepolymerans]QPC32926.1 chain length-determining protein [Caldimonas thermodepolymerans]UZG49689.1 Wzz/FepE/Etk N-terminal domain-containing protein [Caldimonas thermodepolymerans]
MDTTELLRQIRTILRGMWRRRWWGLAAACVTAVLGGVVVAVIQDRYEASSRVYVDTQSVLKPLMAGLAFQPDIDQQVRMLARTLVSRPNVERLMDSPEIGLAPADPRDREKVLMRLMDRIKVNPSGGGNLYTISYRDTSPERARRLVEGLVNLFMESSIDSKARDSQEASRFIDEQIADYERKLVEAENRLKDFKLRNFGMTGVSNQDYFARISELSDQVSKLRIELSAAEQSRDALRRELASEEPQLPPDALPATGGAAMLSELDTRLEAQKRQLDELLRRYTEEHPDVVATRRTIAQIEEQRLREAQARGDKRGAATNPVFQRIRMALAEAEANVASLRTRLAAQQAQLDQIRARASRIPQVEAELAQLNRDYDVIRRNYEQLVARREAASLGVKIDQSSPLTDFRLVEPARVAPTPVFPSRKVLAVLVVLAAIGAGVAATFGLSQLSPSFDNERTLRELSGRPVLGTVSLVLSNAARVQQRRALVGFAGAVALFFVANAGWVAWVAFQSRV